MRWYTLNTRPHHERSAELNLERLGVETLYPQLKQTKVIRRRRQTRTGPLFPGYLFARFDIGTQYRTVAYARGVRNIVSFGSVPATVSDEIIEGIRARLQEGHLTVPAPSTEGIS